MIKTNIKMRVTSEESKQVQEICFANGLGWVGGDFTPTLLDKEYLIAKGLYERVLEIDWNCKEVYVFRELFIWFKTEEGYDFWDELNAEMFDLDIYDKIESLIKDYKEKQGKEFIKHIETKPEEVVETKPLEKPKQYLCYVQGKALPKHIHKTLEQAKQEAQRLCRKELAKVSVLEVVAEFEAEVLVKEVL